MNFIKIPNSFVQEYKYSNETVYVYGLIQKMLNIRDEITFNLLWLYDELNINANNKRMRKKIKDCLIQLENDKYLIFDTEKLNDINRIIFVKMNKIDDFFVLIEDKEFNIIHNYKNANIYKLFIIFANLKSRCNYNGQCFPSFEQIKIDTGIKSDKTLVEYLNILRDKLKLILYDNPGMGIIKDTNGKYTVKQLNNIYMMNYRGNEEALKEVIEYKRNELKQYYNKIKVNKEANDKRSKAMIKYHANKNK